MDGLRQAAGRVPLLLLAALASLYRLRGRPGRLGQLGFLVTGAALALLAVGTALEFWPFAWGSYGASFEATSRLHGGLLQALASLTLTLGLVVLALDLHRARFAPFWIAPVLGAGALTTVYLTPVLPVPGLVCLVLGAAVWRRPACRP